MLDICPKFQMLGQYLCVIAVLQRCIDQYSKNFSSTVDIILLAIPNFDSAVKAKSHSPCGSDLCGFILSWAQPRHIANAETCCSVYLFLGVKDVLRKIYNLFFRFVIIIVQILNFRRLFNFIPHRHNPFPPSSD